MKKKNTKQNPKITGTAGQEAIEIAESDFADYLRNLEDYETRLARGEIQTNAKG